MGRTIFLTNDFPPRRGGIETFVLSLCREMDPDNVVVYTASMPDDLEYDVELPFPVYRDPAGMLLPTPAVGRRVIEVMRRHDCDRVVFGASAPLGLLGRRLRRAGARRIVALTHGHEVWWARVPVTRQLLRRIGDSVDVTTYVSEWCRERVAPALSDDAATRMERLSPTVDADRFYPGCGGAAVRERLRIPADAPVVVCTARFVRRKGQDTLVKAWPTVLAEIPNALLLLVGDGPDRRRIERMVRRRGVANSVIFTGSVPWDEVPAYTDAGDAFAMPVRSRWFGLEAEAFGIVFLEAQACGLPVLAGRSGGSSEALRLAARMLIDHGDEQEVSDALRALLGSALGGSLRSDVVTAPYAKSRAALAVTANCRQVLKGNVVQTRSSDAEGGDRADDDCRNQGND